MYICMYVCVWPLIRALMSLPPLIRSLRVRGDAAKTLTAAFLPKPLLSRCCQELLPAPPAAK